MHEHRAEIRHDFRRFYGGLSADKIGTRELSHDEAFDLCQSLLKWESASLYYVSYHKLDKPMSTEGKLLVATHNKIVDSIQVDKKHQNAKQKAKLSLPEQIKTPKKTFTREQALKRFASSRVADE